MTEDEELDAVIEGMTDAELRHYGTEMLKEQPIWMPLPGPQTAAAECLADVTLYGGAAGGGKSDLAIGLAMTEHRRTLFVRQEATQLLGVYDRVSDILGGRDGFSGQNKIWRFNTGKARQMQFGGVPNPGDENKFQGNPRDLLVLDEAANLREEQVRFLMGWVRTTIPGQRCRTLMCSNPPTAAEGMWIIDFFGPWLDPQHHNRAEPGELRWFATIAGEDLEVESGDTFLHNEELITPMSRTFIPSRITDNPYLTGTGYMTTLQSLPEPLRSQMLYGDFLAGVEDDAWQVIPTAWVQAAMDRWTPEGEHAAMDAMGVDVSRGGMDESILAPRHGNWFAPLTVIPGHEVPDGPTLVGRIVSIRRNGCPVQVDAIGVGTSVVDTLRENEIQCEPMTGSESSNAVRDRTGTFRYRNKRAMWHWQFREVLDPASGNNIALPPDNKLKADLCAPTFEIHEGNVLQVEGKKHIIKRLGRSTDRGDAVIYANVHIQKSPVVRNTGSKRYSVKRRQYGRKS